VEKELEKVKVALEDFGKKVLETVKKGKGEADKVTRIAQVKIELGSLGRQRKDLCLELGGLFYSNYQKATQKGQADIAETVTNIAEIDKKVASLNRTLKAIREDKAAPRRRGRPPKREAAKAQAAKAEAPKRRGRPPKAASAKAEPPKRRGRPPKNAAAKAAAPKRRGRPPKSAPKGTK
jgi:DNA repair exonuclease SbcCD ATPase subunit